MSIISSFIGTQITLAPSLVGNKKLAVEGKSNVGLVIENSSRPQKKATAHHRKTRPRKTQPWDINRKPTVYAPLPPLPPDWTLLASDNSDTDTAAAAEADADAAAPSPASGAGAEAEVDVAAPSPAAALEPPVAGA